MDTTGDGIIDDFLAVKKRGRKSLGLDKEEMKARREMLRKIRVAKKREEEKRKAVQKLIYMVEVLHRQGFSLVDIAEQFVVDPHFEIKFNENASIFSGREGSRIKRKNVKKSV